MNYAEAVAYLDTFVNYEKTGYKDNRFLKPKRMCQLAKAFGNPHNGIPFIHVAGTKGKGSIASFAASILKESGFSVGLYTSPHILDPRERIKINGKIIPKKDFTAHVAEIEEKFGKKRHKFSPSFFELYTLLAFKYFKEKKIDCGVIEVGLGGRLDATNIIRPKICVISPVSHDHMHVLGRSLKKIAYEKCGIIKEGCMTISSPQKKNVLKVMKKAAGHAKSKLMLVGRDIIFTEITHDSGKEIFDIRTPRKIYRNCKIHLIGRHQIANACTAVGAVEAFTSGGIKIEESAVKKGLEKADNPCRCEIIARKPYIVLDGAQNKASAATLKSTIKRNFDYKRLILVLGASKKKDIKGIIGELAQMARIVILTKAGIERAEEPLVLKKFVKNKNTILTNSVPKALKKALSLAKSGDLILVTGSFFVTAEAKASYEA